MACSLAAIRSLVDRASAPEAGVRAAYVKLRCAEHKILGDLRPFCKPKRRPNKSKVTPIVKTTNQQK